MDDVFSSESLFQLSRNTREQRTLIQDGFKLIVDHTDLLDDQPLQVSTIILKTLRQIFDDEDARFKSVEQAEAIKEILKRDSDLAVILPTGGGKSLVYQLPILIERDLTTVVIVPFVALVEQVEEQFKD